jgi:hypothetical protein
MAREYGIQVWHMHRLTVTDLRRLQGDYAALLAANSDAEIP